MHARSLVVCAVALSALTLGPARAQSTSAAAASPSVATASPMPRGWVRAASLRPGAPLRVQLRFAPAPTLCTLVWIDNAALACDGQGLFGASERLVFPAAQVYSVSQNNTRDCDQDCGAGKRMLVGAVLGGTVGGLIFSRSSGGAAALGAMLGAGTGGGIAAGPQIFGAPGMGPPMRPAMSMRVPLRRPARLRFP